MLSSLAFLLTLKLTRSDTPASHNVVDFPVVRLSMSLAAAIYRDDYGWINDPAYNFAGNLIREYGSPANEDQVQFCVYNQTIRNRSSIFIVIRGSSTQEDFDGNLQVTELSSHGTFFHLGFHRAGTWLLEQVNDLIPTWDGYVFFVGHSRGGAVATAAHTLAQFTYRQNTNFYSLCFAPPPAVADRGDFTDLDIRDHMFSFVYDKDPIPRFSIVKVDQEFESPEDEGEMERAILLRINVMWVHPFAQRLVNSVQQKRTIVYQAMHAYQTNANSIHVLAPQGRVYLLLPKLVAMV
jgi:hypothetical protein